MGTTDLYEIIQILNGTKIMISLFLNTPFSKKLRIKIKKMFKKKQSLIKKKKEIIFYFPFYCIFILDRFFSLTVWFTSVCSFFDEENITCIITFPIIPGDNLVFKTSLWSPFGFTSRKVAWMWHRRMYTVHGSVTTMKSAMFWIVNDFAWNTCGSIGYLR